MQRFSNMSDIIEFDTARLKLRQWLPSDLEPFAALNADPRVMEFYPALLSRAESDAQAEGFRTLIEQRGWGLWVVETKAASEFIGYVGLHVPTAALPFVPCVEIGWRMALPYWGKGFATEAARGVLRVGFETLLLPEIVSFTAVVNRRSSAVMERLGMSEDAESFEHPNLPEGHWLRRHCLYRLSRERWLESAN